MITNSLETPEYATFILGDGVNYETSKPLVLITPTKMSDIVLKIISKNKGSFGGFSIRVDYHNAKRNAKRIVYNNLFYRGGEQHLAIPNPAFDDFLCTYIMFDYPCQVGETEEFIISADKFEDEKEKQIFLLRQDNQLPTYKDEI